MTTIPSAPIRPSTASGGMSTALSEAEVERLKRQIFDATPMGLCLMLHGVPQLINARFAELLGGRVAVESLPGSGSAFHVVLPVALTEATEAAHAAL